MPNCSVINCDYSKTEKGQYQSFRFPEDPELRRKWLEKLQKEGKLSEEKLKNQAEIFFNGEIKEDKKVVKKKLSGLLQKRNNQLLQSQRKLQKEIGGLGKYGEKAPVDFGLAITDEKKRNLEFIKM